MCVYVCVCVFVYVCVCMCVCVQESSDARTLCEPAHLSQSCQFSVLSVLLSQHILGCRLKSKEFVEVQNT